MWLDMFFEVLALPTLIQKLLELQVGLSANLFKPGLMLYLTLLLRIVLNIWLLLNVNFAPAQLSLIMVGFDLIVLLLII